MQNSYVWPTLLQSKLWAYLVRFEHFLLYFLILQITILWSAHKRSHSSLFCCSTEKAFKQSEVGVPGGTCHRGWSWSGDECPAGHLHRNGCVLQSCRHRFRKQHGLAGRWWRKLTFELVYLFKIFWTHIQDHEMLPVMTDSSDYDHLTMEDLISYSFQVAKGMDFLSSRKV